MNEFIPSEKPFNANEFADYFINLRNTSGYASQRELAEATGINNATLSRIESGKMKNRPRLDTLRTLTDYLRVSFEELATKAGYSFNYVSYQYSIVDMPEPPKGNELALAILANRLKFARETRNEDLETFANKTSLTVETIKKIENAEINVSEETLFKISSYLGVTNYFLLGIRSKEEQQGEVTQISEGLTQLSKEFKKQEIAQRVGRAQRLEGLSEKIFLDLYASYRDVQQIPVFDEITEDSDEKSGKILGYESIDLTDMKHGVYFYLTVKDDDMIEEGIRVGYRLLVKRQHWIDAGELAIVQPKGEKSVVRRVYFDGDRFILQGARRGLQPKLYIHRKLRIIGKVIRVEFDPNVNLSRS